MEPIADTLVVKCTVMLVGVPRTMRTFVRYIVPDSPLSDAPVPTPPVLDVPPDDGTFSRTICPLTPPPEAFCRGGFVVVWELEL